MNTYSIAVCGIPCQAEITFYSPEIPMRITGSGFGDADPPEYEEIEFRLLDRKGYPAAWLERIAEERIGSDWYADVATQLSQLIEKEGKYCDY